MFPYIETESGFQTLVNNRSYSVNLSHPHYKELYEAVLESDDGKFLNLFSTEEVVSNNFDGTGVVVKDGMVYYGGNPLHNVIADKIVSLSEKGLDPQPMIKFLENLMKNPSSRAVNELYNFLMHKKLPITEDGCFIAYKSVKSNFKDKYTGTIDNSPGQIVEFARNQVNDDKNVTCSYGLHVGALEYAGPGGAYNSHGDKVVIVKVNPADAVSVPVDHNAQKLRVCKYEVLSEYETQLSDNYYPNDEQFLDHEEHEEEYDEDHLICHVDSSTISLLLYSKANQTLTVYFCNGTLYRYKDVARTVYDALTNADSVGSYFNKNVANNYRYEKLI